MQKHLFLYAWLLAIVLIALLIALSIALPALFPPPLESAFNSHAQWVEEVVRHAAI